MINNERDRKKPPLITCRTQKALKQLGFIEEIDLENISIEISGRGKRDLSFIYQQAEKCFRQGELPL